MTTLLPRDDDAHHHAASETRDDDRLADESRVPGAELPGVVYVSVVAAFAWILVASWLAFAAGEETDLGLAIATVLGIVIFALPIIMWKTATRRFGARRQRLDDFLHSPIDTATGKLTGSQMWLQILVIPLTLALAAILFGAVHLFAA